ncbi:hypothetical protein BABINDRAFT_161544 [Babjeviella inositovora NRRL Y-12698]|uniref:SH3 domain-containing protein n=1 Tax=Babjeviella inositovora NRRL Y-12698 TaxID=984486 RepID=A0A1E3QQ82_9ASCO|nr:uncharacterized protein BABINDRAFT_161544 [Babjeviella inositovora NRRL Y-12698]ODQ79866.1 hypothetical protein BABINDRAFT_161544 [Babjeviella inositovora NRRL Y-12698]
MDFSDLVSPKLVERKLSLSSNTSSNQSTVIHNRHQSQAGTSTATSLMSQVLHQSSETRGFALDTDQLYQERESQYRVGPKMPQPPQVSLKVPSPLSNRRLSRSDSVSLLHQHIQQRAASHGSEGSTGNTSARVANSDIRTDPSLKRDSRVDELASPARNDPTRALASPRANRRSLQLDSPESTPRRTTFGLDITTPADDLRVDGYSYLDDEVEIQTDPEELDSEDMALEESESDSDDYMLQSPPRSPPRELDPDKLYALYDFSGPDPLHCNIARDEPVKLINDEDNYWWLVRRLSDNKVGFAPAEVLETYGERLARLNCWKNEEIETAFKNGNGGDTTVELASSFQRGVSEKKEPRLKAKSVTFLQDYQYNDEEEAHSEVVSEPYQNIQPLVLAKSRSGLRNVEEEPQALSIANLSKISESSQKDGQHNAYARANQTMALVDDLGQPPRAHSSSYAYRGDDGTSSIGTFSPDTSDWSSPESYNDSRFPSGSRTSLTPASPILGAARRTVYPVPEPTPTVSKKVIDINPDNSRNIGDFLADDSHRRPPAPPEDAPQTPRLYDDTLEFSSSTPPLSTSSPQRRPPPESEKLKLKGLDHVPSLEPLEPSSESYLRTISLQDASSGLSSEIQATSSPQTSFMADAILVNEEIESDISPTRLDDTVVTRSFSLKSSRQKGETSAGSTPHISQTARYLSSSAENTSLFQTAIQPLVDQKSTPTSTPIISQTPSSTPKSLQKAHRTHSRSGSSGKIKSASSESKRKTSSPTSPSLRRSSLSSTGGISRSSSKSRSHRGSVSESMRMLDNLINDESALFDPSVLGKTGSDDRTSSSATAIAVSDHDSSISTVNDADDGYRSFDDLRNESSEKLMSTSSLVTGGSTAPSTLEAVDQHDEVYLKSRVKGYNASYPLMSDHSAKRSLRATSSSITVDKRHHDGGLSSSGTISSRHGGIHQMFDPWMDQLDELATKMKDLEALLG